QWWRDVIREAASGGEPKAHEVAGPLARLIQTDAALVSDISELDGEDVLSSMVSGYEVELDAPFTAEEFDLWAQNRFGARLGLAGSISPLGAEYGHDADDSAAARVLALGLACRTAHRMAAEKGHCLLPDTEPEELGALARGEVTSALGARVSGFGQSLLDGLRALRRSRRLRGEALIAHLPIAREARIIARIARDPARLLEGLDGEVPFSGLRLAWAVWRRRW
ncbi:MAG: hypothetical protein AAGH68_14345, partial [Pseudomonadota bacterium]